MRYLLIFSLLGMMLLPSKLVSALGDGDYDLTLIGIVLDNNTKEPMQNATVVLVETDDNHIYQTTTTQDGRFYFQLSKEEEYQIYAAGKNGITGEVKTIQTYNKQKPELLNVILTIEDDFLYKVEPMDDFSEASYEFETYRPNAVVFKVQFGAFNNSPDDDMLTGIEGDIEQERAPNGQIRYLVGNYQNLQDARAMKVKMRDMGFAGSMIITYLKGERSNIPPEEASKLSDNNY